MIDPDRVYNLLKDVVLNLILTGKGFYLIHRGRVKRVWSDDPFNAMLHPSDEIVIGFTIGLLKKALIGI